MNYLVKSKYTFFVPISYKKQVMFNSIYGSADLVSYEFLKKWKKGIDAFTSSEINFMRKRGHITEFNKETELLNKISNKYESLKDKKSKFYLIFSYLCNFCCFYCFENLIHQKEILDESKLKSAFKAMQEIAKINGTEDNEIVLFGGEPLLKSNMNLIEKTFKFAQKENYRISVITNGANVYDYYHIFLHYKDIIEGFSITLDGTEEVHNSRRVYKNGKGSHSIIINNIKLLLDAGFRVSIRMNIDESNSSSIRDEITNLKEIFDNRAKVCISLVEDSSCNNDCNGSWSYLDATKFLHNLSFFSKEPDDFSINIKPIMQINSLLYKQLPLPRFKFCRMSELYVFSPNGGIYNCPKACDNLKLKIGNYWPLIETDRTKILDNHSFSSLKISMCKECELSPICGGGCLVTRLNNEKKKVCYKKDITDSLRFIFERMVESHDKE